MACGWLYNPGNPHAVNARATPHAQIPKYYRVTVEPFSMPVWPDDPFHIHIGPQDVICKNVRFETFGRMSGAEYAAEYWMVQPDRSKLINYNHVGDQVVSPTSEEHFDQLNPGEKWQDWYPRAQWWVVPTFPNDVGFGPWSVLGHFWYQPSWHIPSLVAGGGAAVDYDFWWVGFKNWNPFGKNECLSIHTAIDSPPLRAWVEAYWP